MTPAAQYWGLQVGLPGLGLALLVGGVEWEATLPAALGVLLMAAGAVASGLACAAYRRVVFLWPGRRYRLVAWHGNAALGFAGALLTLGAAAGAAGLAHLSGCSPAAIREAVLARPSLGLVPAGAGLLCLGLGIAAGFPEGRDPANGRAWNLLLSVPNRLGGAILLMIGAGLLGVGGYELASPEGFDAAVAALSRGWPW
ncbi:MAG: hypothetical protein ACYDA8_11470 [Deferrisomatales bacterium]